MSGLRDLLTPDDPQPCPNPAAYVTKYVQGVSDSWVAVCDACGDKVKHDRRDRAERIRRYHNETGRWEP